MIGFEFNQGFTKSLRDWDFTERRKLDGNRIDLRFGIRATWTIPLLSAARKTFFIDPGVWLFSILLPFVCTCLVYTWPRFLCPKPKNG